MTATTEAATRSSTTLLGRFAAFVAERHPFALRSAVAAMDMVLAARPTDERDFAGVDALREPLRRILNQTLADALSPDASAAQKLKGEVPETTPRVSVTERLRQAVAAVVVDCDGFVRREAIAASPGAGVGPEMPVAAGEA